ncbi:branched-chain amino acid ABC transporter permease [Salsipaludibacter albus]|uniref:branched-chain amino acid ABC transporter permease n=1 Tax=Salsipaludibacter albus TaxID=2849650 RepID=UPI001EE4412F|nr:branched-chain amino acid ABC transporter permease [Salsipaludibacter albus]MBY5164461.1 branched-chain amino acid ABC transporter permease [Salsipaludibacter albus]
MNPAVIFDGVVDGLQLGLLAVGLTLLYGLGGILNLAHGQIAVLGGITAALLLDAGWGALPAAAMAVVAATAAGLVLDQTIMRPVYRERGEDRILLSLLVTLGVGFVIDGLLVWRYPSEALTLRVGSGSVEVLGITMRVGSLYASAITIVAIGLVIGFLRATRAGRAVRSVIEDEVGAELVGVNPSAVRTLIFGLSGALAGLFAVTQSMTSPVTSSSGVSYTILALIVTVVGGLGSATGALLAGLILGIVNAISAAEIGSYITSIILLAAAALTILVRPSGLLGRTE